MCVAGSTTKRIDINLFMSYFPWSCPEQCSRYPFRASACRSQST